MDSPVAAAKTRGARVTGDSGDDTIPAASLILFRDAGNAAKPAQHLMIERPGTMTFAAGALVFPGGRIEPDDFTIATDASLVHGASGDAAEDAAAVAAVRETLEETGIVIGIDPKPASVTLQIWRRDLKAGEPFGAMLRASNASVDIGQLLLFARWLPKLAETRRFDTRFFLARVDRDQKVEADAAEAASHHWLTAAEAIEGAAREQHHLVFPTQRNLERLAMWPGFDAVEQHVGDTPIQIITPEIRVIDNEDWLCIPADAGYPVCLFKLADLIRQDNRRRKQSAPTG